MRSCRRAMRLGSTKSNEARMWRTASGVAPAATAISAAFKSHLAARSRTSCVVSDPGSSAE